MIPVFDGVPTVYVAERIYAMADEGVSHWTIATRLHVTTGVVERTLRRRPKSASRTDVRGRMGAENERRRDRANGSRRLRPTPVEEALSDGD